MLNKCQMLNAVYVLAISEKEIFRFKYTEYKISERFSRKFEAGVTKKGNLNSSCPSNK